MVKSIYVFFVSVLISCTSVYSQKKLDIEPRKGGIMIGTDLSRFAIPLFETDRTMWEAYADVQVSYRRFIVLEVGNQKVTDYDNENYIYSSNGMYFKFGTDKILFSIGDNKGDLLFSKKKTNDNDFVYGGFRYGFSTMSQTASFTVEDAVFGNVNGTASDRFNTHWLEGVFGMKVEMVKNVFMGISGRLKLGLVIPKAETVPVYINAGYGNGRNKLNVGFTYSIYYRIPFGKFKKTS